MSRKGRRAQKEWDEFAEQPKVQDARTGDWPALLPLMGYMAWTLEEERSANLYTSKTFLSFCSEGEEKEGG